MRTTPLRILGTLVAAGLAAGIPSAPTATAQPVANAIPLTLQPFMVTGVPVSWRYGEVSHYEVLSCYPDKTSQAFAASLEHSERVLHALVPDNLLASFAVPRVIILSRPEMMSDLSRDILKVDPAGFGVKQHRINDENSPSIYPNQELIDRDRTLAFVTRVDGNFLSGRALMDPAHVRYMLERRTPALPAWFVTGICRLYDSLAAESLAHAQGMVAVGINGQNALHDLLGQSAPRPGEAWNCKIPPYVESKGASRFHRDGGSLFAATATRAEALRQLLEEDPPSEPEQRAVWEAHATLFVRWGLDSASDGIHRRESLWELASLAAEAPATEATVRTCFGVGYSELGQALKAYLPLAQRTSLPVSVSTAIAGTTFRPATSREVARLKGDWERLALGGVKETYAAETEGFVRTELRQAGTRAPLDSQIAAVRGLFECDHGRPTDAQPFLEQAVSAGVSGPRVYFELARLRYQEVRNADGSPLTEAETAGARQQPAMKEAYDLAAKVLKANQRGLSKDQIELIRTGLKHFPSDTALLRLIETSQPGRGPGSVAALSRPSLPAKSRSDPPSERFDRL